jgi:hypothetical protein
MNTYIVYAGQFPGSPPKGGKVENLWILEHDETDWREAFFDVDGVLCWKSDGMDWYDTREPVDLEELADYEALWMQRPFWGELVRSVGDSHEH